MKCNKRRKNVFICLAILLGVYILYGMFRTYQESDIVRIDYVGANPTEFTFPVSVDSVRSCIRSIRHERSFKGLTMMEYDDKDSMILRDVVNRYKFSYVYKYGSVYKWRDMPGVLQHYEFKIDLQPVSQGETKVIVNSIHHTITSGVKFWLNLTFNNRYFAKNKDVESTTIEEYELLRYIGKLLGCIDQMPYVEYPSGLSKHEILLMFGSKNPFSLKEMFHDEQDTEVIGDFYDFSQRNNEKYITDRIKRSLKHVGRRDRKEFIEDIKPVFSAHDAEEAEKAYSGFERKWRNIYPGAFEFLMNPHTVEKFFNYSKYPLALRRIVCDSDPQLRNIPNATGIRFLDTY